jgi:hypothetical protein
MFATTMVTQLILWLNLVQLEVENASTMKAIMGRRAWVA